MKELICMTIPEKILYIAGLLPEDYTEQHICIGTQAMLITACMLNAHIDVDDVENKLDEIIKRLEELQENDGS